MGIVCQREMCENLLRTYERETGLINFQQGILIIGGGFYRIVDRWAVSGVSGTTIPGMLMVDGSLWITRMSRDGEKMNRFNRIIVTVDSFFKKKSYYIMWGWFSE